MKILPFLLVSAVTLTVIASNPAWQQGIHDATGLELPELGIDNKDTTLRVYEEAIATCQQQGLDCTGLGIEELCMPKTFQAMADEPLYQSLTGLHLQGQEVQVTPCNGFIQRGEPGTLATISYRSGWCLLYDDGTQWSWNTHTNIGDPDGDGHESWQLGQDVYGLDENCFLELKEQAIYPGQYYGDEEPYNAAVASCNRFVFSDDMNVRIEDQDGDGVQRTYSDRFTVSLGTSCQETSRVYDRIVSNGPDPDDEDASVGHTTTAGGRRLVALPCHEGAATTLTTISLRDRDGDHKPVIYEHDTQLDVDPGCNISWTRLAQRQSTATGQDDDDTVTHREPCPAGLPRLAIPSVLAEDKDQDNVWRLAVRSASYEAQPDCTWTRTTSYETSVVYGDRDDYDDQTGWGAGRWPGLPPGEPVPGPIVIDDADADGIPQVTTYTYYGTSNRWEGPTPTVHGDVDDQDPQQGAPCPGEVWAPWIHRSVDGDGDGVADLQEQEIRVLTETCQIDLATTRTGVTYQVDPDDTDPNQPAPNTCQEQHGQPIADGVPALQGPVEDADGDGVPSQAIGYQAWTLNRNCAPSTTWQPEQGTTVGDPDDGDPTNPPLTADCESIGRHAQPLPWIHVQDQDGDNWPVFRDATLTWTLDAQCNLEYNVQPGTTTHPGSDPDDQEHILDGGCPIEVLLPHSAYGAVASEDQDGDGVPRIAYWSRDHKIGDKDGACTYVSLGNAQKQYLPGGDPDDLDAGNPAQGDCTGLQATHEVPGVELVDQDQDHIPVVHWHNTTVTLNPDCSRTTIGQRGGTIGGDPDDTQPPGIQVCQPASIRHPVPGDTTTTDGDLDTVPVITIGGRWIDVDSDCNTSTRPADDYVIDADSDDTDPDTPIDRTALCQGVAGTQVHQPHGTPGLVNEDGDAVSDITYQRRVYNVGPRCEVQQTSEEVQVVRVDPDDQDPGNPLSCLTVAGDYWVPSGYQQRDQDQDGFHEYRVQQEKYVVDGACTANASGLYSYTDWVAADPNDNDPDVPVTSRPCASVPIDQVAYMDEPSIRDEDSDGYAAIWIREGSLSVDDDCTTTQGTTTQRELATADPDDQDPLSPEDPTGCVGRSYQEAREEPIIVDVDGDRMPNSILQFANTTLNPGCAPLPTVWIDNATLGPDVDDLDPSRPGACGAYEGTVWLLLDNATHQDTDADGVPVLVLQYRDHSVQRDCTTTATLNRTEAVAIDPDDQDPDNPLPRPTQTLCGENATDCTVVNETIQLPCTQSAGNNCDYTLVCDSNSDCTLAEVDTGTVIFEPNGTDEPDTTTSSTTTTSPTSSSTSTSTQSGSTGAGGTATTSSTTTAMNSTVVQEDTRTPWLLPVLLGLGVIMIAVVGRRRR